MISSHTLRTTNPASVADSDIYDVAIVGLGPAGSMCARMLDSKRLRTIAFDKKPAQASTEGFHKPCGGLLAPDAQKALAGFNLNLPKDVLVDPQIFSVKTLDCVTGIQQSYQRMYINVDRQRFDCWLKSEVPVCVEVCHETVVVSIKRVEGGYALTYRSLVRDEERTIIARKVVGADGAHSRVRSFLYPQARIRTYVALQQWFKEEHPLPFYSCVFDPRITDCYSWGISKDGYFIFGGAYPVKKGRDFFERQKEILAELGYQFGSVVKTESCQVLRPQKMRDFYCGRDNMFLVGEAAGFISASSLEGISSALASGRICARVINESVAKNFPAKSDNKSDMTFSSLVRVSDATRDYKRATLKLRLKLLLKVYKCPFMYWPPLRAIIMKSGLQRLSEDS